LTDVRAYAILATNQQWQYADEEEEYVYLIHYQKGAATG